MFKSIAKYLKSAIGWMTYKPAQTALDYVSGNIARRTERQEQAQIQSAEGLKVREYNAAEAQKARDFQMEMSNTQVQRRMNDLKAAGINPILAANPQGAEMGSTVATAQALPARGSQQANQMGILPILTSAVVLAMIFKKLN